MNNYIKGGFCILMFWGFFYGNVFAHSNDPHKNKEINNKVIEIEKKTGAAYKNKEINNKVIEIEKKTGAAYSEVDYFGDIFDDMNHEDFPTLHPAVVHIPVVLIPLAFIFAIISMFNSNMLFFKLSIAFLFFGITGGFIAAFPLHPHTINLSQNALNTLSKHDFFAYATLWLGSISTLLGLFYLRLSLKLIKYAYVAILLFAVMSVVITGNYGGKLAYIYGIGVQGQYLIL